MLHRHVLSVCMYEIQIMQIEFKYSQMIWLFFLEVYRATKHTKM